MAFERISVDPHVMGGLPCVRGLRIPVATVAAMVAEGMTVAEILADLPDLEPEDVAEVQRYAAGAARGPLLDVADSSPSAGSAAASPEDSQPHGQSFSTRSL